MVNYVVLFFGGVGVGIIGLLGGLLVFKRINLVSGLWSLCATLGILGILCGFAGVYIETFHRQDLGLWLIVLGAMLMGMCGVFATLGSKYQAERKQRRRKAV